MKISTSTYGVTKSYGTEDGMRMLANAGFEAVDLCLHQHLYQWDEGFLLDPSLPEFGAYFKDLAKTIRSCGLEIRQCHPPYAADNFDIYPQLLQQDIRAIYAAGYMEIPFAVIHPVIHPDFSFGQQKERARQATLDYFSALLPALKDTGVVACIENLCLTDPVTGKEVPNYGTEAEDLCDVIDTLNDMHGPYYGACLDSGHALLTGHDPGKLAKALGKRIKVVHLHDNGGTEDDHLIPSQGIINWREFASDLGRSGYDGTLNFEVAKHFTHFPKDTYSREVFQQACSLLYAIGRSLADIAEEARRAR